MRKALFKYYLIALTVSFAVNLFLSVIVSHSVEGFEAGQATALLLMFGLIFSTFIFALVSIPIVFVSKKILNNVRNRLLFYFGGSVITLIAFIFLRLKSNNDADSYIIFPPVVFLVIQIAVYRKMMENPPFQA